MEFSESIFQSQQQTEPKFRSVRFLRVNHPIFKETIKDYNVEVPVEFDSEQALLEFKSCNGRVYLQEGNILEHNTLELDEWLIATKGARFIIDQQTS